LILVTLVAVGLLLWSFGSDMHRAVMQAKAWMAEQGAWAWVLFLVMFVVLSCLAVPDSLFCIAAGALFGFVGGIGVVLVGATLARAVQFALSKRVMRARVRRYVDARPRLGRVAEAVLRDQFRLQFMIRLTPVSLTLGSYLFASIGVRFSAFMRSLAGTLPSQLVMVYLGVEGAHVAEMGARSDGGIGAQDVLKFVGLVVSVVVLVIITRIAVREVRAAIGEGEDAGA
jgi:uncharacterized membrane protein YdjX (TVP38/TMEM64 family)